MKILIADDDAITRLLLSSALTKLGHDVHEATNGREAWNAWEGGEFPFIISDWMMPDLDGLEFCRRIRAERRADYTYTVLLTSRAGKTNYLEAMTAGVDDFITKPFEKDELTARVRVAERVLGLHANLCAANTDLEVRVRERTAELKTALQAKDEFLSRASHELRTPMNHVLGFAQLLERHALTSAQAGSVQQILSSGQHLLRLIDRILAVSKSVRPFDENIDGLLKRGPNTTPRVRSDPTVDFFYSRPGGLLYPFFARLLNPVIAGAAMSLSSVSVIANAWLLRQH
jgi:DNA-binding response OmpR family regulator